jgi:hypothetical protein
MRRWNFVKNIPDFFFTRSQDAGRANVHKRRVTQKSNFTKEMVGLTPTGFKPEITYSDFQEHSDSANHYVFPCAVFFRPGALWEFINVLVNSSQVILW